MYPAWRTQWLAKLDRASLAKRSGPLKRLRSETLVSSIHLFRSCYISPTYSTLDYLLLALCQWKIKVVLLVKSTLSSSPLLWIQVIVSNLQTHPQVSITFNQVRTLDFWPDCNLWVLILLILIIDIHFSLW
jgi:hypothetical protein